MHIIEEKHSFIKNFINEKSATTFEFPLWQNVKKIWEKREKKKIRIVCAKIYELHLKYTIYRGNGVEKWTWLKSVAVFKMPKERRGSQ